ncbi:CBS domain-containing protein [Heliorestis acidaminivorans]|uniref:CBS domain-containing protein n=1 Tax=Heliorestis acidaminivorans TaxID=553427 RepID=A0A6I0EWT4_9FIRM|nr:CBS domain-containing protein [Heliorestis acidaminivorans]KAB2952617.1 CBS domain-containing protein [Heliorestis acidaminivorans]
MEIILTHNNTDFDGLAAAYGAHKLYPRAIPVLPSKLGANVQEFMALHKDTLGFKAVKKINPHKVKRIIMVDTKSPHRVGPLGKLLADPAIDVHVFDHHPPGDDDVVGSYVNQDSVGAVTTIIVEEIQKRKIKLTSFDATLLALGIYEDTGSLMFSTTTARDAAAIAYLLGQGANLAVVGEFIDRPLSVEQRKLFHKIMRNAEVHIIQGFKIVVTTATVDEYVEGLSLLVYKLSENESPDVIFAVVKMEDRVIVVGRSRIEHVKVNKLLLPLGGGGHGAAAAASIKGGKSEEILALLVQRLYETIEPQKGAREIMSSPVKTVTSDTTIEEAGKVLLRYGHTGMPIVDGDKLVGVISRRDLDKAFYHGLRHAPVKGFMSRNVLTIDVDSSIREIQSLMIEHDIGRLPVIEKGKIIGIVSRTDVLRTLHGEDTPRIYRTNFSASTQEEQRVTVDNNRLDHLMEERLPDHIITLFQNIGQLADEANVKVYVVGGFVRDLLLGVNNLDIDLVVEGDGIAFATRLARFLRARLRVHEKFGTAMILWEDQKIDVATARREFYQHPAALPQVEASNLRQDLYRRDFTINALALQLNLPSFGYLVDFFSGRKDLDQGLIRVLYNLSFVEDPTRIIRAIRFEQRYDFTMEVETLEFAHEAISRKMIGEVSHERMFDELLLILQEKNPVPALRRVTEMNLWDYFLPDLEWSERLERELTTLTELYQEVKDRELVPLETRWMPYFLILTKHMKPEGVKLAIDRYPLKMWIREAIVELASTNEQTGLLMEQSLQYGKLSDLDKLFQGWSIEAFLALRASYALPKTVELLEAWHIIKKCKTIITGKELKEMGIKPGPHYKTLLNQMRWDRLDGIVQSYEEELEHLRELLFELGFVSKD